MGARRVNRGNVRLAQKREEAAERQALYDTLTTEEKLKLAHKRGGKKEQHKLALRLAEEANQQQKVAKKEEKEVKARSKHVKRHRKDKQARA